MPPRKRPNVTTRRNSDGSWSHQIRWRQDGHRYSHTFEREGQATEALTRIMAAGGRCQCPEHAPPGVPPVSGYGAPAQPGSGSLSGRPVTFGEWAGRHVDSMTGVGPGYRSQVRRELARHFGPFLDRPVDGIDPVDVREWIRGLEEGTHPWTTRKVRGTEFDYEPAPLSPTTIRRLLVQASGIMAAAQDAGLVTRNPFRGHRVGRRDRDQHTEMTVLTPDEWAILSEALPAGTARDLCTVLVGTGLRFGEATALAVGAVDPLTTPPRLHVARAWQSDGANGYQLGTPKSRRSRRTVTFTSAVLDAVLPHLSGKRDDELVFTTERGMALRHSNFYHRVWQPALDQAARAGLTKRPRIHDLRHTHVSWLIAEGRPVSAISRRVGHESVSTTDRIYTHLLPQVDLDDLAALDRALPGRRD